MALPSLPAALVRAMLPLAEREEVLADLGAEYDARVVRDGRVAARWWLWRQVTGSLPALARRSWWRGRTGFDPRANVMRPGGPMLERAMIELRFVLRRLRTRPTYTLLAVLTLALGVGGSAAMAGIVRAVLLDPLPYRAEQKLVHFWGNWTPEEFLFLRDHAGRVAGVAGVAAYVGDDVTLEQPDAPTRLVPGAAASSELFATLGVAPLVGPGFAAGDDVPGSEPRAVLSYALWQELGGDPAIVGTRLDLDGITHTVSGVMPRGFWFPDPTVRLWTTLRLAPDDPNRELMLVGRLRGGAPAAMGPVVERLVRALDDRFDYPPQLGPTWDKTKDAALTPLREQLVGAQRPALLAMLAGMAAILLMAGANVAALMLGQVESRATELAVRAALGADRTRLVAQLATEAGVIGVLAGASGALVARLGWGLLVGALPLGAWSDGVRFDWTLFTAAMAIALLAALVVAVLPAVAVWLGRLGDALGRGRTGGVGTSRVGLQGGLVVAEVAVAVLLCAGAALLARSVANLYAIDPGVDTRGVAVLDVTVPAGMSGPERQQTVRTLIRELGAIPGVRLVGATHRLPLRGPGSSTGVAVEGAAIEARTPTFFRLVTPGYLEAMGIALRRGRTFAATDLLAADSTEQPVIVNASLARKYFGDRDPVGQRLLGGLGIPERIVGVVEDVAEARLTDPPAPARYLLIDRMPRMSLAVSFVLRTERAGDAERVLGPARRIVQRAAPAVAVRDATTMARVLARAVGPARQVMALLALLTGLALVLGAIGVYGVIAHFVSRRGRDWSIRIALGLSPARVITHVVGRSAALVSIGVAAGLAAALALSRLLASFLYGVAPADPLALAAATAALLAVGVLAALVPAWRAARADPARALREQ